MEGSSHWGALARLIASHRGRTAVMGAVLAVAGALPLAGPLLIARFVDEAADGATDRTLFTIAGLYVAMGVGRQLMAVVVAWSAADLAWRVTNELRSTLARHVLGLDLSFHRATSPGELVSRVDHDVTALSEFVSNFVVKALAELVTLIGMLVIVTAEDWRIGLGLAIYLAVAVATVFAVRDLAVDEAAGEQAATGRMLGEVEERLNGADDLRSNGGGSHAVARFQVASARVLRSTVLREKQAVVLWMISNGVFVVGGLAILALDAALLRNGTITLGTAYLLFQYTQLLREPLGQLADEMERVQRAAGGMVRTLQLLGERSAIDTSGTARPEAGALSVDFDDVSFAYDDEDPPVPVLDHLDLRLDAGRSLGVLGRTGSGKTTLSRVLLRLVDVTDGEIRLGGLPLRSLDLEHLRSRTGVVSQDVHLFAASIRDNLRLFDETIDDAALHDALAELQLTDWLARLPEGLDTVLGPGGEGLSAGESQLVALTRLFLRSPDLVVLDEASSRVDPETERAVIGAIDRLTRDRTAIVIAHRLSTVERLDEILVLDRGRVAEHGPTAELRADPDSRYSQYLALGSAVLDDAGLDDASVDAAALDAGSGGAS